MTGAAANMKVSISISRKELEELRRNTGASTIREAILVAVKAFNRQRQLDHLSKSLYGSMPDFITQADLRAMREE